ncbi:amino acid adenylation domain-containing protein [Lentzea sp. NPDC051213]|uniref:amino acid adenylation domain-containing protein n=1 Tax=Lentzea sp. NPDC051213 TaxID=3364126 RepID=UPI0037B5309D
MSAGQGTEAFREELIRLRMAGGLIGNRVSIGRADRDRPLPLSFGQRQLWFLNQLDPEGPEYLVPLVLRLRGPLDEPALRRVWGELVARHEILRTRYEVVGGEPTQVVLPPEPPLWTVVEFGDLPPEEREAAATARAEQDALIPFNLEHDLPLRITLLRIGATEHLMVAVFHHIASDAISQEVLLTELGALYAAFTAGRPSPLPAVTVQYADYAAWQQEWQSDNALEHHLWWWRNALADLPRLDLPTDRPRPAVRRWHGAAVPFSVRSETVGALDVLAKEHNATPFMVLLTAFQCLLARYTGQDDVAVGTVASGRTHPDLTRMLGYVINNLVLRMRIEGSPSFQDMLVRNRINVLEAFDHQAVPFARLVDEIQPERDMSVTPLFQVAFTMHGVPANGVEVAGLRIDHVDLSRQVAKFDLAMQIAELPDGGLGGQIEYSTDLFDAATVRRLAEHFTRLLDSIAADPGTSVRELDFLLDEEFEVLTGEPVDQVAGPNRPVRAVFEEQVSRTPDAVAVVCGTAELTYAELNGRANRLAHHLRALGVGAESLVGVCLERGDDLVPALVGVTKSGAGYLPLDPAYPADRLRFMVSDAAASVVVTTSRHLDMVRDIHAGTVVVLDDDARVLEALPETDPEPAGSPGDLAYVIYTSGSTGRPKGVCVTNGNVLRLFTSSRRHYGFDGNDVWSMFHSYAFDVSVWEMWGALLHGGRLVVVPFDVSRSPDDFIDLLVANRVTILSQTPSAFRSLVTAAGLDDPRLAGLALRAVVFAGEKLELSDLAPWVDRFGCAEPELINMYGITETTVHSTFHRLVEGDFAPGAGNPIGYPLDDTRILLLDQHRELVPIGLPGEMYVGGPGVTRGYLNRPELTEQRFVTGVLDEERFYRSGDLARRMPDGSLQFLGRIDHQVKLRGFRIELGEIVSALAEHPSVRDAVVVLREDEPGDKRLVAYLVPAGAAVIDPGELRTLLGRTLPDYMVPSAFVSMAKFPLTTNGKLDQRALPSPDESAIRSDVEVVAPRTVTETRIAAVWREVLGIDTLGVHDGFFDLGGDSIRAVALVGMLKVNGFTVAVRDVFEHRTIARLAEFVDGETNPAPATRLVQPFELISQADRALVGPGVVDAYPLSKVQAGMLVEMLVGGSDNIYHNVCSFKITDEHPFSEQALRDASASLVERHEILRTSLDAIGYSVPMQLVHATAEMPIGSRDLRGMDTAAQTAVLHEFTAQERATLFDVAAPPLLRYFVHVVDDGWWISITECHVILEGWSYHSLLMELLTAYHQIRAGGQVEAPPMPEVRFADYVAAELESLESTESREYWRDIVARHPKFELPSAWRGEGVPRESYRLELPCADIMGDLRAVAKKADVSLKSVLHSAYLKVMSTLTDEATMFTGLVCDARPEILGADRVHGMYLNTVPFPFTRSAGTWRELVQETFAGHVGLWPHRRFPLPEIHREAGAAERLIDTFFIYLDFHVIDTGHVDPESVIDDSPNEFALTIAAMSDVILLHTNTEVLTKENGERLIAMYRSVLEAMILDLDGDAHVTFLPEAERRTLLTEWNRTERPLSDEGVVERFREFVRVTPNAVAVVDETHRLTYEELARRASAVSECLTGDEPGSLVAILDDPGARFVAAVLGVMGAGHAYLPLDPAVPVGRTAKLLSGSGAGILLVGPDHREHAVAATAGLAVRVRVLGEAEHPHDEWVPQSPPDGELGLAYVIYTSGSTGLPKGAMVHRRGMVNHLLAKVEDLDMGECDVVVQNAPLTFDVSVWQMLAPLIVGGQVRVVSKVHAADPAELFSRVEHERVSILEVVPSLLRAALDGWDAGVPVPDLAGLRWLLVTGEALPPELCVRWFARFPCVEMVNAYGPTECSDDVTHAFLTSGTAFDRPLVPIGKAIRNTRLYVLDVHRQPVPVGILGELHVGGAGVGHGYLHDPERTARAFVVDPFSADPGHLLYRTGDRVRHRPDGQLEFVGRRDNQVKIRGQRIELGELEAALMGAPGVRDAAAKVDQARLVGYVVGDIDTGSVREHIGAILPDHLVPSALVVLDALPLTPNGKVDRKALPAPDRASVAATAPVAPRSETEARLAEVWSKVLGLGEIGVEDDFFALGGDSIRTLNLVSALRSGGFAVSVRDVFEHRTIAGLAGLLAAGPNPAGERALAWLRPKGNRPALYCAHPQGGSGHWLVPLADHIGTDGSVAVFEAPASIGDRPVDLGELSARYLREMSAEGPFFLLGWSSGATLAWEMGRQLAAAGTPATAVVLIDPIGDPATAVSPVRKDWLTERLAELFDQGVPPADDEFAGLLAIAGLSPAESDVDTIRRQVDRTRMLTAAMYTYRYPSITTPVHLVVTDECAHEKHGVLRDQSYATYLARWHELAAGGLRVHRVAGDHDGILQPSRAAELAELIDTVMTEEGIRWTH